MPPTGPQLAEDTLEGLVERVDMRQPMAAHASYQKIVESGSDASEFVSASRLFDFRCFGVVGWVRER